MVLTRPWFSIILTVVGSLVTAAALAGYIYPIELYGERGKIAHNFIAAIMLDQGRLHFVQVKAFDRPKFDHLSSIGGEERHEYYFFRVSDHVAEFATFRDYSASLWLGGIPLLLIGIRGYVKRWVIPMRRMRRGQCVVCGYDMRSNVTAVCSECGAEITTSEGSL